MGKRGNFKFMGQYAHYLPGWGGMFVLLALLAAGAFLGALAVTIANLIASQALPTDLTNLISYPLMFIPAMIFASAKSAGMSMSSNGVRLDSRHFAPLGAALCAVVAAVGTFATSFWADGICSLLPEMPDSLKQAMDSLTKGRLWACLLCAAVFAPFFEEWLCRGLVLRGLLAKGVKPVWAIIASACFFAVIHFNPWQAIPAFILGCLMGYVYYRTGSLKLTMLMHFTNNFISVMCTRIDAFSEMETWRDVFPSGVYGILIAATFIISVLTVLAFSRVKLESSRGNLDTVPSLFDEK